MKYKNKFKITMLISISLNNKHGLIMLSSEVARINDYLIRSPKEEVVCRWQARLIDKWFGRRFREYCQQGGAYFNAVVTFPLAVLMDAIILYAKVVFEGARATLSLNAQSRQEHWEAMKAARAVARKCVRGLLAFPAGLLFADIVTRHFVPPRDMTGIIEAGGKYHREKGEEIQPTTVRQLGQLIRGAIADGRKVTISGAHFSQSKDTLPSPEIAEANQSVCINMRKLNRMTVHPEKKTVTVQAGATWSDVQREANKYGLAVKVMQASNVFSVGGSLGVNCHGWDHRTGTLGETVRRLTIYNGIGQLQVLDRNNPKDRELMGLVIGGHGLFGVIVEAELELSDNETLVSWGKAIAPKDYVEHFEKEILPYENHQMHLYRLSLDPNNLLREGIMQTYSRKTEHSSVHGIKTASLVDEEDNGSIVDRIMVHVARRFPFVRKMYWGRESLAIQEEVKSTKNEIMRPVINAAFNNSRADAEWLQEYFVPGKELAPFLEKLGDTLMRNEVSLLNCSVRFVKKDALSKLPYAPGEDHYAVVLFFNQSLADADIAKTKAWVQEIIDYLLEHDGKFYLPYQHFATPEQFEGSYPQAEKVIELKKKYDPSGLFDNGLYHDYLKPLEGRKKSPMAPSSLFQSLKQYFI